MSEYKRISSEAVLMREAYRIAATSKDPSTQNGALVYDPATGLISGYSPNRLIPGVKEPGEVWNNRGMKYPRVLHAERGAIYDAWKQNRPTVGCWMVCPWAACSSCAITIIESGITRLVRHMPENRPKPAPGQNDWQSDIVLSDTLMREAGIELVDITNPIEPGFQIRHSGKMWYP